MTPELSSKIRNLTFFAILGVLLIHSFNAQPRYLQPETILAPGTSISGLIEFGISNSLARFVIPFLFTISGFLFFFRSSQFPEPYGEKLLKRFRSVLRPYFLWNFIGALFLLLLGLIPWIKSAMPDYLASPSGEFWAWSLTIFPLNFPLWYLRDLFLLVLLAPTLEKILLAPIGRWVALVLLVLLWFFDFRFFFLGSESVLFFFLGSLLGLKGWNTQIRCSKTVWIVLAIILATLSIVHVFLSSTGAPGWLIVSYYKLVQALGVVVVWTGYDLWFGPRVTSGKLSGLSFYIFVGHQPLMILLIDPALKLGSGLGNKDIWSLVVFIVLPVLLALFWILIGSFLRRFASPVHNFLTGGR